MCGKTRKSFLFPRFNSLTCIFFVNLLHPACFNSFRMLFSNRCGNIFYSSRDSVRRVALKASWRLFNISMVGMSLQLYMNSSPSPLTGLHSPVQGGLIELLSEFEKYKFLPSLLFLRPFLLVNLCNFSSFTPLLQFVRDLGGSSYRVSIATLFQGVILNASWVSITISGTGLEGEASDFRFVSDRLSGLHATCFRVVASDLWEEGWELARGSSISGRF